MKWLISLAFVILVIAISMAQSTNGPESKRKGKELILDISDEQRSQYLNQDFTTNAYNYGYEVSPDGQFHHEVHGPDDVTYGCYGYVNPLGKLRATFYISDDWGYRVVQPGQSVEIFLHEHEHHVPHGILTAWKDLYFPPVCRQFEGTDNRPVVIPSTGQPSKPDKPAQSGYSGQLGIPGIPGQSGTSPYLGKSSNGQPGTSESKPSKPGYPGYPSYSSYSDYPGYPYSPEGPVADIGGVGGTGGTDNIGNEGIVGSDGPDGPSPGGQWPGNPNYILSVKPTSRPHHQGPVKVQSSNVIVPDREFQLQYKSDNIDKGVYSTQPVKVIDTVYPGNEQMKQQHGYYGKYNDYQTNVKYKAEEINLWLQDSASSVGQEEVADQYKEDITPQQFRQKTVKTKEPIKHIDQVSKMKNIKNQQDNTRINNNDNYFQQFVKDSRKLDHQQFELNLREETTESSYQDSERNQNKLQSNEVRTDVIIKQVNTPFENSYRPDFGLQAIGVQPPRPISIKSLPLPIGPDPQTCPCVLIESQNDTSITTSTTPTPVIGQLGFVPVIFVPYCSGDEMYSQKMKAMFLSATPVPYACNACGTQDGKIGAKFINIEQLGNVEYLKQALSQANIGFLNIPVKVNAHKRKVRSRKIQ